MIEMNINEEILNNLRQAFFNTHLVIPLKYNSENNSFLKINKKIEESVFASKGFQVCGSDLHEIINNLFSKCEDGHIACAYSVDKYEFLNHCFGSDDCTLYVDDPSLGDNRWFEIDKVFLYVLGNGIAFICLSFEYKSISTMRKIYDPSYVKIKQNKKCKYILEGSHNDLNFVEIIEKLLRKTGLELFFDREEDLIFSDAYAMSLAVVPKRIGSLRVFKKIAYNLQRMYELEYDGFDEGAIEASLLTYPNSKDGTYQWCACVGDCSISRVRCADVNKTLYDSFQSQVEDYRGNSLTLVLLALYQKYASLLFSARLRKSIKKGRNNFNALENEMINFKAFGEISVANVSRVAGVRKFYRQVIDVNGVDEALKEIDKKLSVISSREKEKSESKTNAIMIIISLFSVVSILADMISVMQSISTGNSLEHITLFFTVIGIVSIAIIAVLFNKKR